MARVTEVSSPRARRIRVRLDDGLEYVLSESLFRRKPLMVSEDIDASEYSRWILLHQYQPALNKAVSLLACRPCSKAEISRKLAYAGYSSETVDLVLYKLEKNNLLDDRDFAQQWIRYRSDSRFGPRRIIQELKLKGVSEEDISSSMQDLDEDEMMNQAVTLAEKKLRHESMEEPVRKLRMKIVNSIVRRGFDWDVARKATDTVLREAGLDAD